MSTEPTPRSVRTAGALVSLQGLCGLIFAIALAIRALSATAEATKVLGEAGYYVVIGGAVAAAGIGLLLGKHWARAPSIVVQLVLLGVAWYAVGPSSRPEIGVPIGILCIGILVLLFGTRAREWAHRASAAPDADNT